MRNGPKAPFTRPVTDASFKRDVLSNPKPVLVDFWAQWCMPCHALAPVLEKIAKKHADRLDVVKLDIDENRGFASRYAIRSIPTMKLFIGGKAVTTLTGIVSRRALEAELVEYLTATNGESR